MATGGIWKRLVDNVITVTLKFGFYQNRMEYSAGTISDSIVEHLYCDAENWMRQIASKSNNLPLMECYTYIINLFRISSTECTMIPITQASDIEQNSLIEIVLVPIEKGKSPHSLYRCQFNTLTYCNKCSRLIFGLYKQGFRCQKCRMTYHKECAPFLLDDCVQSPSGSKTPTKAGNFNFQLTFINPFVNDPSVSTEKGNSKNTTIVPIYGTSMNVSQKPTQSIESNTIIDKGIFPACVRGAHFCRRYLFRLTTSTLSMTTNISRNNVTQQQLPQANDPDMILFLLTDIDDIVLTHFQEDRDNIFEIHLRNKTVISVGKRTDSEELQMETAQFYSTIRDQREASINTTLSTSNTSLVSESTTPTNSLNKEQPSNSRELIRKESIFRRPPRGKDNEDKDLHELYAFTGEKIGEGAFGRVAGAYRKSTNQPVAIKIMEKDKCTEQGTRRINEEVDNLYKFNHANILKLEAYFETDDAVYLVTERMETDMCKYITTSPNSYLDEQTSRIIIYQVVVALRYLHGNNCGHLDIKCDNILISLLKPITDSKSSSTDTYKGDYPFVKLADFGYSRIIGENSFRKTRVGTKVYNAPEIYNSKVGYNRLADMWSVGIVLYAALSGTLPYDERSSQYAEEIVLDKKKLFPGPRWAQVSREATDLIANKLLVVPLNSRIRSTDALFHDWFTNFDLYKNLREIEKLIRHSLAERNQDPPTRSNWLTGEREDLVWLEYQTLYSKPKE